MKTKKEIEVLIKYPSDFLSENDFDGISMFGRAFRESVDEIVRDEVVKKIMEEIEIPKVEFTEGELKDRILTAMARRVLEKDEE